MKRECILSMHSYRFVYYMYVLREVLQHSAKNKSLILDAGCGNKGFIVSPPPDNAELVCVDILRTNIAALKRKRRNFDYVVADLTMLPFSEGVFNGAVCADVLEHVEGKNEVLQELARTTKKGGWFLGCTSNLLNPILLLDSKLPAITKPLITKYAPGHYERHSRFDPNSLSKAFNKAGYRLNCLMLLGSPMFNINKMPWLDNLWIVFDKITNKKPLLFLKENIVWQATRN